MKKWREMKFREVFIRSKSVSENDVHAALSAALEEEFGDQAGRAARAVLERIKFTQYYDGYEAGYDDGRKNRPRY